MSNKPKIYSYCNAGCKWETIHKTDFLEQLAKMGIVVATGSGETVMMRFVTQAEYNALVEADELLADCLYIIEDDATLATMSNRITTAQSTANTANATANSARVTANANKTKIDAAFSAPALWTQNHSGVPYVTKEQHGYYYVEIQPNDMPNHRISFGVVYVGNEVQYRTFSNYYQGTNGPLYSLQFDNEGSANTTWIRIWYEYPKDGVTSKDIAASCSLYMTKIWG